MLNRKPERFRLCLSAGAKLITPGYFSSQPLAAHACFQEPLIQRTPKVTHISPGLVVKCKTLNKKLEARLRRADKAATTTMSARRMHFFISFFRLVFLSGCLVCFPPFFLSLSLFLAVPLSRLLCVVPRLKDSCVKERASHLNKQFDTLGLADFSRSTRSEKYTLEPNPRTRSDVNYEEELCEPSLL